MTDNLIETGSRTNNNIIPKYRIKYEMQTKWPRFIVKDTYPEDILRKREKKIYELR